METRERVISVECARGCDGVVGLLRALLSINGGRWQIDLTWLDGSEGVKRTMACVGLDA